VLLVWHLIIPIVLLLLIVPIIRSKGFVPLVRNVLVLLIGVISPITLILSV